MASIAFASDLERIARASPWFMDALAVARDLQLTSWCIGAGAVRNLVWDALHGYVMPSALADVDVAYFDACASLDCDAVLQAQLTAAAPHVPWEVTNQDHGHRLFERYFGHAVEPLHSLTEAVASWPEYATAVGVYL